MFSRIFAKKFWEQVHEYVYTRYKINYAATLWFRNVMEYSVIDTASIFWACAMF